MSIEEMEAERKANIRNKGIPKELLGTMNHVEINKKKPRPALEQALDKTCLLYKSSLFSNYAKVLDKFMVEYHALPEEEQIKQLPFTVKEAIRREFLEPMKRQAEYYAEYRKDAREPLFINDESDTKKYVLDVDYLKDTKEVIDFPYQSIKEITMDKSLSMPEKIAMCNRFMEVKTGKYDDFGAEEGQHEEKIVFEVKEEAKTSEKTKTSKKTTKQMWQTIKEKYPKNYGIKQLLWETSRKIDGVKYKYIPYCITANPKEVDELSRKYIADVNVHFVNSQHYIREDDMYINIFRVRESEIGNLPSK